MRVRTIFRHLTVLAAAAALAVGTANFAGAKAQKEREFLVFFKGTPQELEVYKIYGRAKGPTVMILGGIQGDEPGGFLSADLYADLALKKGNLIVVPRANFRSILQFHRGPAGDMNRKFDGTDPDDAERLVVDVIRGLMAESDLFLNLHDGSGFYRSVWESEMANPKRYGQSVIADSDHYTHPASGRRVNLRSSAEEVIRRVNREIDNPLYKFHFFNMFTVREDTGYKEQRKSATYYALTRLGIPAFGIETSKQLPSLEMKIHQHNLVVNAFLDLFGVEVESPRLMLDTPELGYVVVAVNNTSAFAAADGQTLLLTPGDTLEVVDVRANYERGLSVELRETGAMNALGRPVVLTAPADIVVRKENTVLGRVHVDFLPQEKRGGFPLLTGEGKAHSPRIARATTPGLRTVAVAAFSPSVSGGAAGAAATDATGAADSSPPTPSAKADRVGPEGAAATPDARAEAPASRQTPERPSGTDVITGFLLKVDGRPVRLAPGEQVTVTTGARVTLVDLEAADPASLRGVVMNLRGFVPRAKALHNDGEDRGHTADTARDMMSAFSRDKKGEVYDIHAERGKEVLASCSVKIAQATLVSVSLRVDGQIREVPRGAYTRIASGAKVELLSVALADGLPPEPLSFTLGGRAFPPTLPQTLTMRDIALNLAVFHGKTLAGKVTWIPW